MSGKGAHLEQELNQSDNRTARVSVQELLNLRVSSETLSCGEYLPDIRTTFSMVQNMTEIVKSFFHDYFPVPAPPTYSFLFIFISKVAFNNTTLCNEKSVRLMDRARVCVSVRVTSTPVMTESFQPPHLSLASYSLLCCDLNPSVSALTHNQWQRVPLETFYPLTVKLNFKHLGCEGSMASVERNVGGH